VIIIIFICIAKLIQQYGIGFLSDFFLFFLDAETLIFNQISNTVSGLLIAEKRIHTEARRGKKGEGRREKGGGKREEGEGRREEGVHGILILVDYYLLFH